MLERRRWQRWPRRRRRVTWCWIRCGGRFETSRWQGRTVLTAGEVRGLRLAGVSVLDRRAHDKQKAVWQTSGGRWGQIHLPTVSQAHFWNCYSEPSTSPFQKFFETKASIYHDGGVHGCCWHAHVSNETERKRWWVTPRGEQRMDHLEIKPNGFLPLRSRTNISKIHHFIICTNIFILL